MNFTGHAQRRLPGHVSFWIEYVEGESLLLWLSMSGVCAASGSACSSNIRGEDEEDLSSSHVLTAIGVPPEICHGSICFSLGKESTEEEVDFVLGIMPGIVERLWAMSPLYAERHAALEELDVDREGELRAAAPVDVLGPDLEAVEPSTLTGQSSMMSQARPAVPTGIPGSPSASWPAAPSWSTRSSGLLTVAMVCRRSARGADPPVPQSDQCSMSPPRRGTDEDGDPFAAVVERTDREVVSGGRKTGRGGGSPGGWMATPSSVSSGGCGSAPTSSKIGRARSRRGARPARR